MLTGWTRAMESDGLVCTPIQTIGATEQWLKLSERPLSCVTCENYAYFRVFVRLEEMKFA